MLSAERDLAFLEELAPDQLQTQIFSVFFHRICKMAGIELSARAMQIAESATMPWPRPRLNPSDLVVNPRCKSMNIAEMGRAMSMWERGQRELAVFHFENALNGPLVSATLLANYAECLSELDPLNPRVESLFQEAMELTPDPSVRFKVAAWRESIDLDEARVQWLRALSEAPVSLAASHCRGYIACLNKMGRSEEAAQVANALFVFESTAPLSAKE